MRRNNAAEQYFLINESASATIPTNDNVKATINYMEEIINCLMSGITKKHDTLNSGLLGDNDSLYIINNIYDLSESLEELKNRINYN